MTMWNALTITRYCICNFNIRWKSNTPLTSIWRCKPTDDICKMSHLMLWAMCLCLGAILAICAIKQLLLSNKTFLSRAEKSGLAPIAGVSPFGYFAFATKQTTMGKSNHFWPIGLTFLHWSHEVRVNLFWIIIQIWEWINKYSNKYGSSNTVKSSKYGN